MVMSGCIAGMVVRGFAWVMILMVKCSDSGEFGFATALSRDGSTLAVGDWNHSGGHLYAAMICRARILTKMALRIP